jgi:hypothetical protein
LAIAKVKNPDCIPISAITIAYSRLETRAVLDEIAAMLISETKKTFSSSIAFFLGSENSSHGTPFCIRTAIPSPAAEIRRQSPMPAEGIDRGSQAFPTE